MKTLLFACALALSSWTALAQNLPTPPAPQGLEKAIFAGGCFWCMEHEFDDVPGVISAISGYIGGSVANPSYREVSNGATGHAEAVEVLFDPKKISYIELMKIFWRNIDPTVKDRQFCDGGPQYRSAIFWVNAEQRRAADAFKASLVASGKFKGGIYTEINPATVFYQAEEYHQDYAKKNPVRYGYYRSSCGRDARLREIWGAPVEKSS
jgi:peptide-methionine (S)-S-oxide reductase